MAVQIGSGYGSMLYNSMEMLKTRASAKTQSAGSMSAADAGLSAAERSVLAQESALKASAGGAKTTTTYKYEIGPDGRKYIVGAEVSISGTEDQLDAVPGGMRQINGNSADAGNTAGKDSAANEKEGAATEDSPETRAAVAELKSIEREVIAHEAAHMAVGGRFAGGVSYSYTTGPDGKKYITGGEVPISTPAIDDPEEALRNAEQVMRAAMAPANPSSQDAAVAASAAQTAIQARAQLAADAPKKSDAGDDRTADEKGEKGIDAYTARRAMDAYAASGSTNGLWIAESADGDRFIGTIINAEENAAA